MSNICGTRFSFRIDLRLEFCRRREETTLIASVEQKACCVRCLPHPVMPVSVAPRLIRMLKRSANIAPIPTVTGRRVARKRARGDKSVASCRASREYLSSHGDPRCARWFSKLAEAFRRRKFKAVQTGGLFRRVVSLWNASTCRWIRLARAGSIMDETLHGSMLRNISWILHHPESCANVSPARDHQMHRILGYYRHDGHRAGFENAGSTRDLLKHTSLCGLGQSAPNPGSQHPALVRRGIPGAHSRAQVSGWGLRSARRRTRMRPCHCAKTLKIDGRDISGRQEENTILDVAPETHLHSGASSWRNGWPLPRRRLPFVPGRDQRPEQVASPAASPR